MSKPYLTLVLPCFNESEHIEKSFPILLDALDDLGKAYEVIFVEDVSSDNTKSILRNLLTTYKQKSILLIEHSRNMGRGQAVKTGLRKASGTYAGFLDADLEISPSYIKKALAKLQYNDVVIARRDYKYKLQSIHRHAATRVYRFITKHTLGLPISDSEAGFKFFNRNKILPVLKDTQSRGWFWDTEIVYQAARHGLKIDEVPVKYIRNYEKASTVNTFKDSAYYVITLGKFLLTNRK